MFSKFTTFTTIKALDLTRNGIANIGVSCLSFYLKYLPQLENIWLGYNYISPAGILVLAGSLNFIPKLKLLDLKVNPIEDDGITILSHYLKDISNLEILNIGSIIYYRFILISNRVWSWKRRNEMLL